MHCPLREVEGQHPEKLIPPPWREWEELGLDFWNEDFKDKFDSEHIHVTRTARAILKEDFLPIFSIRGIGFKPKTRMFEDPELAISAAEFGWPKEWFQTWKIAEYTPIGEYKSIAKYNVKQRYPPGDEYWEWSYDYMAELFAPVLANVPTATHEDVVWAMDGTKSAGLPFTDCQDTYHFLLKYGCKLRESFEYPDRSFLNLWNCKVKEELRPAEKIALNKVRTFTASNKAYQYQFNRLFLNQTKAFVASGGPVYAHTIGFSKYGRNWHVIGRFLEEHPNVFDYDVDTCDGETQNHEKVDYMFSKFAYLPKVDQTDHNFCVFQRLMVTEIFSIVVDAAGTAWLIVNGTKSGSPDTAMSTTWIIKRRFVYAFFKLGKFKDYEEAKHQYHKHVRHMGQGDDGVWSVSDECVTWFNHTTLSKVFQENGWHISTLSPTPRALDSVVFLSNWFRKEGPYWVPVPASDKMCVSMAYTRQITPAMSLVRAAALYQEGFWSELITSRLRLHIARLRKKYGDTLKGQSEWNIALHSLKGDSEIQRLYLDPNMSAVDADTDLLQELNTLGGT
jgi:hypothetical protein